MALRQTDPKRGPPTLDKVAVAISQKVAKFCSHIQFCVYTLQLIIS